MKCALIIPAWLPEELFSKKTSASQLNYWQPLGTLYVAASLKEAGHEVEFYNGAFLSSTQIIQKLDVYKPRFIGLYATTFGWDKALHTAKNIKSKFNNTFICVGGPYPIAMQSACLDKHHCIDAVVTGEAEITVPKLIHRLESGQSLHNLAGITFRHNQEIISNDDRPLIENLDKLPFPARELLDDVNDYTPSPATYRRKPVALILSSRGCNRRCIFCSQIDRERKYGQRGIRFRSVENVIREIEYCLDQGYREIKFIDDTLAANYDRLINLTREIQRRKLDFTWFASACVNQVDKPLLKAMKEAGCWAILFGVESGVQKNLNTLRKGTTLLQIKKAVAAAKEVGLKVTTSFVFGIPGETYEEGLQTIDFAIALKPDIANFHALTAFPGTYLYNNLEKYGRVSNNLSRFTYQGASFEPYTISHKQISDLRQQAFRRFYSRPAFLLRQASQIRTWTDITAACKGIKSLFWLWLDNQVFNRKGDITAND